MIEYITAENKVIIDNSSITVYGICAVCGDVVVQSFDDVSTDKNFVSALTDKLNHSNVELCHFFDVVIDELNQ